jgi:selenide,water dikinase
VMSALNKCGEMLGSLEGIHALTDITGFGLLGHLIEMAEGSNLSSVIDYKNVPLIDGIKNYMDQMIFPDSLYRNWNSYQSKVTGINGPSFITLCDPQTSGGLLVAVAPEEKNKFLEVVRKAGVIISEEPAGAITEKKDYVVEVKE